MHRQRLKPHAIHSAITQLTEELGRSDRTRLKTLVPLIESDGSIALDAAITSLYPDKKDDAALTNFRQFRQQLRRAAVQAELDIELEVDSKKRSPPADRRCWFEGVDLTAKQAERFSSEEASAAQPANPVRQDAIALGESRDGKPLIRYFVSYARKDMKLKDDLLRRLQVRFDCAKRYAFEPWQDGDILPGEDWHQEIQRAISDCHFGILLVSYEFLSRAYIRAHELPKFVSQDPNNPAWRRAVPVGLKKMKIGENVDMKGLENHQIFRHKDKFFSEYRGDQTREDFADDLFGRILTLLEKNIQTPAPPRTKTPSTSGRLDKKHLHRPVLSLAERYGRHLWNEMDRDGLVAPEGTPASLDKTIEGTSLTLTGERVEALEFLCAWAADLDAYPFCAVLGEYGMGKTTTCKAFTEHLLDTRQERPDLPLPLYFDLRHLGNRAKEEPTVTGIIGEIVHRSWHGGREIEGLDAAELIRLVQEEGALAIFDGLDEVLVHLDPTAGQRFTRELWRVLPPRKSEEEKDRRPGKLLITCRTHYFRTLREQKSHLTGEDREGIRPADYRALVLLPFTEVQVRDYLARNLPDQDPDAVLELFASVHNLTELSKRPYTLKLIAQDIQRLEEWRLEGRQVTGVLLYQHMVQSWLERDSGKHQLTPDHKQRLMEHLAARLWQEGRRSWNVGTLEQWLVDFLEANPRIAAHYRHKNIEVLKEDLRTATFLVREGEDAFRFAHSSMQEYFLAARLCRALVEGEPDDWNMHVPSSETLGFLGQLLELEPDEGWQGTLRTIRDTYRSRVSELALAYCLHAPPRDLPAIATAGFDLTGSDLKDWTFEGPEHGPPLNLRGTCFRGARLLGARFRRVNMDGADLQQSDLSRAEIWGGSARDAKFDRANLTGTVFRELDLSGSSWPTTKRDHTRFLISRLDRAASLDTADVQFALCEPADRFLPTRPSLGTATDSAIPRAIVRAGHCGPVSACAFSPNGRSLVSAASDHNLHIWDVASGECHLVLRGHEGWVNACAFSPDGQSIASASDDKTLRLWNAASGESHLVLRSHEGWVNACAFSPDGQSIASASSDGTLRLWDVASGSCRVILHGHKDPILACAFSPDDRYLASAAEDQTLRLWDRASNQCHRVLRGHFASVQSCAFSPDGRSLVSGSGDQSVRLWDVTSGECRLVLRGHQELVRACTFSPDGHSLASASDDQTIRLWDSASGENYLVLHGHEDWVSACAFSPDGHSLISGSGDWTLRLWDLKAGECQLVLDNDDTWVNTFALSPDGHSLASATGDGTFRLWGATSGECHRVLRGHTSPVGACAFSPDGHSLASASGDNTLRLWDAVSGECRLVLRGHDAWVTACAFSPDGHSLASVSGDNTLRLWDVVSGNCHLVLRVHKAAVSDLTFSPDGLHLILAYVDGTLRLLDVDSRENHGILRGHKDQVLACAFSTNGRHLVSASQDQTLRIWDPASGKCRLILSGHEDSVTACAFSANGHLLVSASEDQTLRLWDTHTWDCLRVLRGHAGRISACTFFPDGRSLVSSSMDGTLRIWDVQTGRQIGFVWHHLGSDEYAVVTADGRRIVEASEGAWRALGWLAHDSSSGTITRYPAECLGTLPKPNMGCDNRWDENLR